MSDIHNIHASEWMAVQAYCLAQINELHETNEGDLSENETAETRGQIKMARKVLALAADDAPVALVRNNSYIE